MTGWIPDWRQYTASPGTSATVEIERLAQPAGTGYLMARIPINGSTTEFYTVEVRQPFGYDVPLPGNAVLIHHVDTANRWDRQAQVVDVDHNGDPGDAAAMWVPGETFIGMNGISVSVVSATTSGFLVTITNGSAPPPPPAQFTLVVSKSGNGIVTAPGIQCGGDCQESFTDGTAVALSVVSDEGWIFIGFGGDADCADGWVTMSRDIVCHAEFYQEPRPNLLGWFSSLTKKIKKGRERVSFTFFAHDNGVQPVYGPFTVAFYISDDAILDGSDLPVVTKEASNRRGLVPDRAVKLKGKKVTLPILGSGKYLIAVIDSWSVVPELDEHDNIVAIPIP